MSDRVRAPQAYKLEVSPLPAILSTAGVFLNITWGPLKGLRCYWGQLICFSWVFLYKGWILQGKDLLNDVQSSAFMTAFSLLLSNILLCRKDPESQRSLHPNTMFISVFLHIHIKPSLLCITEALRQHKASEVLNQVWMRTSRWSCIIWKHYDGHLYQVHQSLQQKATHNWTCLCLILHGYVLLKTLILLTNRGITWNYNRSSSLFSAAASSSTLSVLRYWGMGSFLNR